jgi:hypothetical protein
MLSSKDPSVGLISAAISHIGEVSNTHSEVFGKQLLLPGAYKF